MKRFGLLLSLLMSILNVEAQDQRLFYNLERIVKAEQEAHAGKLTPQILSGTADYDVTYYNCHWNVDPAVSFISGSVTMYFNTLTGSFDEVVMNMSNALDVDSIVYHNNTITYTHAANILTANLPASLGAGVFDSIKVYYNGVPASTGFGSFIQDSHNGVPVIWTLSEPYGASDWWPCKNGLTDKADSIDIAVTTPSDYTVASNGLLVAAVPSGPNTTYYWQHRYPVATYLICFAVTNYVRYSHFVPYAGDTLEVVNYIYPEDSLSAVSQTAAIVEMVQLYDTLFGEYPFQNEKYGHAQFGWGGGMEHQTMTFITGFWFDLLAHELAHHWFGDKITCGSWRDIWLNEGFATYLSGLCYEHLEPFYWQLYKENNINNITSQPGGSVWCDDTTTVNRIFDGRLTYAKGAMILHQLRWVIGDSAFYAALNSYLNDPSCAYEFAVTADLKGHFEAASGQNLDWYFDDWHTGQGYPSYTFTWSQLGQSVYIHVEQTTSHPSVPFFQLPLPVLLSNGTQDSLIRIDNTINGEDFIVNIPFQATTLEFDPDLWIISKNNQILLGTPETDALEGFSVAPNPASENLNIAFSKPHSGNVRLQLSDANGRSVMETNFQGENLQLNLQHLSKGVYFVKATTETSTFVRKIVKL